ncbi:MAG: outer membrane protein transport protein [Gammaproteobacteria bacterium]|nr:outer membrane protein transport protein [Gammaproteobacteria bacterium]
MSWKTLSLLFCSYNLAHAGGFQMHEQNASVGDVHAGYAVDTYDASVNFYNSAALTEILNAKTTTSAVTVANFVSFKGSTAVEATTLSSPPIYGSGETSTKGLHVIPSMHYATPINDKYAFGISLASPFAAELEWSDKAFTRYNTTLNGIKAVNLSPSLAYKVSEDLSLGFGPDLQYVSMQINKKVGTNFDLFNNNLDLSNYDSIVTNNLTNAKLGWHAGTLWKPTNNLKLGFNYRSEINHHATGESKLKGKLAGSFGSESNNKVNKSKNLKAIIKIPQNIAFSFELQPMQDWSFVSTVMYTHWSIVDSFDLKNVPTAFEDPYEYVPIYLGLVKNTLRLKDTYTFLNGFHWQYNDHLKLKTGFGYDQTPTNNHYRDLKMPDGNRYLFGLGANYKYSHNFNMEFGWMYVAINKTKINNISLIPDPGVSVMNPGERNEIHGHTRGHAHVIGMQFTMNTEDMYSYTKGRFRKFYS